MIPDYEGMLEAYYTSILTPGDHCVDIGAHSGRHTIPMARAVGAAGEVRAFEPLPHVNAMLREAVERERRARPMANVVISELALGEQAGEAEFILVNELPEYSGFRERIYDAPVSTRKIRVQVERLEKTAPSKRP